MKKSPRWPGVERVHEGHIALPAPGIDRAKIRAGGARLERDIVRAAQRWLKTQLNCWCFKAAGGPFQTRGIADLIGHVHGRFLWAEAKRPGKEPTEHQRATAEEIRRSGAQTFVFHSLEEFQEAVQKLANT